MRATDSSKPETVSTSSSWISVMGGALRARACAPTTWITSEGTRFNRSVTNWSGCKALMPYGSNEDDGKSLQLNVTIA